MATYKKHKEHNHGVNKVEKIKEPKLEMEMSKISGMDMDNRFISILERMITNFKGSVETTPGIFFNQSSIIILINAFLNSRFTETCDPKIRFFNEINKVKDTFIRKTGIEVEELNPSIAEKVYDFLLKASHSEFADDKNLDEYLYDFIESLAIYGTSVTKTIYRGKKKNTLKVVPFSQFICDQNVAQNHPMAEVFFTDLQSLIESDRFDKDKAKALYGKVLETAGTDFDAANSKVKLYEVHGFLPEYLFGNDGDNLVNGMFIVAETEYEDYVVLYSGIEKHNPYTITVLNKVHNRTMGRGPVESMLEAQITTNEIGNLILEQLRATSKIVYQTSDTELDGQDLQEIDNLTLISHEEGSAITQVSTNPTSYNALQNFMNSVVSMARESASIQDASLGRGPKSNTSFASLQATGKEADGVYTKQKKKILTDLRKIYKKEGGIVDMCIDYFESGKSIKDLLSPFQYYSFNKFIAEKKANIEVERQIESGAIYIDPFDEVSDFMLKQDKDIDFTIDFDEKIDRNYIRDKFRLTLGSDNDIVVARINKLQALLDIVSNNPQAYPEYNPQSILMEILELQDISTTYGIDLGSNQSSQIQQTPSGPNVAAEAGLINDNINI